MSESVDSATTSRMRTKAKAFVVNARVNVTSPIAVVANDGSKS